MNRRTVCLFLAAALAILPLCCGFMSLRAAASAPYVSESIPAPVITAAEERDTGADRVISLAYTARTAEAETVRVAYLEQLLKERTVEEIAASDAEWILHGTEVFCEVSPDGKNWYAVAHFAPEQGTAEVSLFGDILPALAKGEELHRRIYGFDYSLRLRVASDDYDPRRDNRVFAAGVPSETVAFHCPEFTFVDCVTPEDASVELGYPVFMYYPNETELPLPYPTRPGYWFAGWLKWNGGYTETVPAGSRYYRVTAQWDPRTYAVNYVLSTVDNPAFSYSFGRADNSANPTTHTVGDSETLYDIKSPVGGYAFDGWFLSPDFSGERLAYLPETLVGDVILYAKWATFEEVEARQKEENEAYALSLGYGDLDLDGKVSSADARLALRTSVGLENLSMKALHNADIFDSGIITPANARTILRVAVGLDSLYVVLYNAGIIRPGELDG